MFDFLIYLAGALTVSYLAAYIVIKVFVSFSLC